MKCNKCNKSFGHLAHKALYQKQICNKCCETAKFDSKSLFNGCKCSKNVLENKETDLKINKTALENK